MHLYSLTLQKASCITQAIHGNFSGTKTQEVIVARGKTIEILRPDPNTGKVHSVLSVDTFGLVRSIAPFRMTGSSKGACCMFRSLHARDWEIFWRMLWFSK